MGAGEVLILSLAVDDATQERLESLRRAYYPATRNQVPAHVTLLHQLPAREIVGIRETIRAELAPVKPFRVAFPGVRRFSNGLALTVEAPELLALHAALVRSFAPWLTPQDRAPYAPHVTIMNRSTPQHALATYNQLVQAWRPFEGRSRGVAIWNYQGGPWELAEVVELG